MKLRAESQNRSCGLAVLLPSVAVFTLLGVTGLYPGYRPGKMVPNERYNPVGVDFTAIG